MSFKESDVLNVSDDVAHKPHVQVVHNGMLKAEALTP